MLRALEPLLAGPAAADFNAAESELRLALILVEHLLGLELDLLFDLILDSFHFVNLVLHGPLSLSQVLLRFSVITQGEENFIGRFIKFLACVLFIDASLCVAETF